MLDTSSSKEVDYIRNNPFVGSDVILKFYDSILRKNKAYRIYLGVSTCPHFVSLSVACTNRDLLSILSYIQNLIRKNDWSAYHYFYVDICPVVGWYKSYVYCFVPRKDIAKNTAPIIISVTSDLVTYGIDSASMGCYRHEAVLIKMLSQHIPLGAKTVYKICKILDIGKSDSQYYAKLFDERLKNELSFELSNMYLRKEFLGQLMNEQELMVTSQGEELKVDCEVILRTLLYACASIHNEEIPDYLDKEFFAWYWEHAPNSYIKDVCSLMYSQLGDVYNNQKK